MAEENKSCNCRYAEFIDAVKHLFSFIRITPPDDSHEYGSSPTPTGYPFWLVERKSKCGTKWEEGLHVERDADPPYRYCDGCRAVSRYLVSLAVNAYT